MNLSQVVEGFFIVRRTRLAATTITNYGYCYYYDKLLAHFGPAHPFADIKAEDIRCFLDDLRNTGLSERSIYDTLAICSTLWSFAQRKLGFPHVVKSIERPT